MSEKNRFRATIRLEPESIEKLDKCLELANCKSRNELFEKAVDFYIGYITTENNTDYLSKIITQTVHGIIGNTEKRLSTIGFKQVVASLKMSKILALYLELDEEQEKRIYIEALNEAKKINGTIPII